jgi:NhaP-type Na+/H+ or K+/H+ antiporter
MDAIRYGFVLPIVVIGLLGWITKHELWTAVLWSIPILAIVLFIALLVYAWVLTKPEREQEDRERRESHEAFVAHEARRLLSPDRPER